LSRPVLAAGRFSFAAGPHGIQRCDGFEGTVPSGRNPTRLKSKSVVTIAMSGGALVK